MIKRIATILLTLTALASLLTGCNTVEGVGRDLSAGGRAISHTAKKVGTDLSGDKEKNGGKH